MVFVFGGKMKEPARSAEKVPGKKQWIKPELKLLGKLKDVAGPTGVGT